jgi:cytochrome c peroxidase
MKTRVTISIVAMITAMVIIINACNKSGGEATPPVVTTPIRLEIPAGWPQPTNLFANNPLTQQGFELGRKLFYDGRLSKDGNFPCASCHQQFVAFANFDHDFSHGFNNQFTTRNSPPLFNLAWHKEFMWDGGINHLEVQPLAPITNPVEMAETIDNVINKLKDDSAYKAMFKAAFGDETVNSQRMLKALSQFMGAMVSYNSKYDKVKRGEASFSVQEQEGYEIYKVKCATCHPEPLFTDLSYRSNGLPVNPFLNDYGRMRITGLRSDSLKFKVPSLRNVQLTYPYMHDGRFLTLSQVFNHYRNGVVNDPSTDSLVRNKIPLTDVEVNRLTYFLKALTDSVFIKDSRFAQP